MHSDYRIILSAQEWNQLCGQLSSPDSGRTQRTNSFLSSLEITTQAHEEDSRFAIASPRIDFSGIRNALRNKAQHGRSSDAFVRHIPNCEYALAKNNEPTFEFTRLSKILLQSSKVNHYNNLSRSLFNAA